MKVIIVEVTRAANTFGRAHLTEIRRAYDSISAIVAQGQEDGTFRSDISPEFATLCFYGAIEQLLTAWIFEEITMSAAGTTRPRTMLVETVCDGLAVRTRVQASPEPIRVRRLARRAPRTTPSWRSPRPTPAWASPSR